MSTLGTSGQPHLGNSLPATYNYMVIKSIIGAF